LDRPLGENAYRTDFAPHKRPLKLFDSNSAHSSSYQWQRGGCIYVGGKVRRRSGLQQRARRLTACGSARGECAARTEARVSQG